MFKTIRIKKVREISHIKIIRYEESIYYANAENFKNRLVKSIGINPFEIIKEIKQNELKIKKIELEEDQSFFHKIKNSFQRKLSTNKEDSYVRDIEN